MSGSGKPWVGESADALAREFKTPLYVYSRERIESAYGAYETAFSPVPHRVCYALKANSSVGIDFPLEIMRLMFDSTSLAMSGGMIRSVSLRPIASLAG